MWKDIIKLVFLNIDTLFYFYDFENITSNIVQTCSFNISNLMVLPFTYDSIITVYAIEINQIFDSRKIND